MMLLFAANCFAKVEMLNDENFDRSVKNGWAIVDFYTDWCGPCKAFAPTFEEVSKEFEGKVVFAKVNGTGKSQTMNRFAVTSIPTLVLLQNGKEVKRNVGPMNKHQLIQWIEQSRKK